MATSHEGVSTSCHQRLQPQPLKPGNREPELVGGPDLDVHLRIVAQPLNGEDGQLLVDEERQKVLAGLSMETWVGRIVVNLELLAGFLQRHVVLVQRVKYAAWRVDTRILEAGTVLLAV